jgi:hypothetical protein
MEWSDVSFQPSPEKLRRFAGLWVVFFGTLVWWKGFFGGSAFGVIFLLLALSVGPLGLLKPTAIRSVYVGWMVAIFPIGWTVSRLVLAAVFYAVLTPLGLVLRLIGRDPLMLRSGSEETYWTPKPAPADIQRYFRPF